MRVGWLLSPALGWKVPLFLTLRFLLGIMAMELATVGEQIQKNRGT